MPKRTGLRKPKKYLKTWDDESWTCRLTPRLSVGMVDEDLPYGKEGGRKSWYLKLTSLTLSRLELREQMQDFQVQPHQGDE
jgi:hypothetical protein